MNEILTYCVGELTFAIDIMNKSLSEKELPQYAPFRTVSSDNSKLIFTLKIVSSDDFPHALGEEVITFEDETGRMTIFSLPENRMSMQFISPGKTECCRVMIARDYSSAIACIEGNVGERRYALDSAVMLLFALASSRYDSLLLHASVVEYLGKGYIFLGKSGTGKSTHSRLWLDNIPGTTLLNDDNPIVREIDGDVYVYGSPWSGKTACYRNRKLPVEAFVRLYQAPHNSITRLSPIKSYGALLPSCSGMKWNRKVADNIHRTLSMIIGKIPVYSLECLPDKQAAITCMQAITKQENLASLS